MFFFNSNKNKSVSVLEAYEKSQLDGATLIDVREVGEYNSGAAKNAINFPLSKFNSESVKDLSKYKEVYVMCRSGGRSSQAVELLKKSGIEAINVEGGIMAWKSEGLPTK